MVYIFRDCNDKVFDWGNILQCMRKTYHSQYSDFAYTEGWLSSRITKIFGESFVKIIEIDVKLSV